jgi:DNA-binding transcriptional regulator LsrR (DeoR family)
VFVTKRCIKIGLFKITIIIIRSREIKKYRRCNAIGCFLLRNIFFNKKKRIGHVDCKRRVLSRPDDKIMMLENLIGIQTSTKKN